MALSAPDLIITISYFSIPIQLVISLCLHPRLTKKIGNMKIVVLLVLFAFFIFLCGAGHLMRCLEKADSELFRTINILTAVVSLVTAIYLLPLVPNLLRTVDQSLEDMDKSNTIIDSMYPETVRERLMNNMKVRSKSRDRIFDESEEQNNTRKRRRLSNPKVSRMKDFVRKSKRPSNSPDFDVGKNMEKIGSGKKHPDPIADEIAASSIMFADIVGFTSWSSAHSPIKVFTLLESIFWEFDELAKDMGVFKVATIGDAYFAATGLLESRADHAVILAQYAERCRRKMNEITRLLAPETGDDTADLTMRFGVHSGPVTAGVLRGHKSRFELFGDTVNTASRIESTGAPDSIQVSQQTADLLVKGGKADWLVAREELVNAKGKGHLQTYWLNVKLPEDEMQEDSQDLYEPCKLAEDTLGIV